MLSFIIVFAERKKAISIFLFWDFYIPFLQLFVCVPSSLLFLYFSLLSFNPIIYLPVFITWLPGAPRTQKRSIFRKCSPFQIFFSSAKCTKVLLMYGSQIRYVLGLCDPKFKTAWGGCQMEVSTSYRLYVLSLCVDVESTKPRQRRYVLFRWESLDMSTSLKFEFKFHSATFMTAFLSRIRRRLRP